MPKTAISEEQIKKVVKEALIEALEERRDLIRTIVEEVLGDFELVEDIREVKKEPNARRSHVFSMREGEA